MIRGSRVPAARPSLRFTGAAALTSLLVYLAGATLTRSIAPWDASGYGLALWTIPGLFALASPRWAWASWLAFVAVQVEASLTALWGMDPTRAGWWPLLIYPLVLRILPLVTASTVFGALIGYLRTRREARTATHTGAVQGFTPSTMPGSSTVAALLEDLEALAEEHPEMLDTMVRETLWTALDRAVIRRETGFSLPAEFGLFSDNANLRLRRLLLRFIEAFEQIGALGGLDTPERRRACLLNLSIRSPRRGHTIDTSLGDPGDDAPGSGSAAVATIG